MLKKVGMVAVLSTAFIFGGTITNADASANTDAANASYKVYYSINGEKGQITSDNINTDKINSIVKRVMDQFNVNWDSININKIEKQQPAQEQKANETEAEVKQPVKEKAPEKKVEQPKAQAPAKQAEQPKAQAPAKKAEQPKAQAPVQQPAKENTQPAKAETEKQASELSQFEQEVVELTNQERAKQGLAPLEIDTELSKVAREKSNDMAVNNYFDHNSPKYGSPFDMMKSFGISYKTAGENIAKGQRTPAEVVNAWMNSEGHRANILNGQFTHIGVGYVENGNVWTQQFIGK
ncbi:hypothetical protein D8M04_19225 [Oceanobacillus piezotolerans]|uniref:SCP domain-containing protein n=1 Tax=Oceanobacillus piezotolerans TaxID=2448030 RepID=A0A498D911_9BACI|nr:CAP domain-containing protein [Oceanobacillus piezotolerans]RLL40370.1 hypothetical protein D8M04_19225 [Oceanobacillus piezotolerans]